MNIKTIAAFILSASITVALAQDAEPAPETVPVGLTWDEYPYAVKIHSGEITEAQAETFTIDGVDYPLRDYTSTSAPTEPGATETTINLEIGKIYELAATGVNASGLESDYSEALIVDLRRPPAPGSLRFEISFNVQSSSGLEQWENIATINVPGANGPAQFFRVVAK